MKAVAYATGDTKQRVRRASALLLTSLMMLSANAADSTGGCDSMTTTPRPEPNASGHAPVNGIRMYYEVHGRGGGIPLVLLHGGGSTIDVTFGRVLPALACSHKLIAVEERGHGRSSDREGPYTFEGSADDVAALLEYLEVDQADVFGFSNGASVALQVAIRHPERVRKLVFASSMTKRDGAHPELWEFMAQADFSNMPQPLKDAFLRVNPDAEQLERMTRTPRGCGASRTCRTSFCGRSAHRR